VPRWWWYLFLFASWELASLQAKKLGSFLYSRKIAHCPLVILYLDVGSIPVFAYLTFISDIQFQKLTAHCFIVYAFTKSFGTFRGNWNLVLILSQILILWLFDTPAQFLTVISRKSLTQKPIAFLYLGRASSGARGCPVGLTSVMAYVSCGNWSNPRSPRFKPSQLPFSRLTWPLRARRCGRRFRCVFVCHFFLRHHLSTCESWACLYIETMNRNHLITWNCECL